MTYHCTKPGEEGEILYAEECDECAACFTPDEEGNCIYFEEE